MWPDDDYLLKLSRAHYAFQYVEGGVIHALHHATGEGLGVLETNTPRQLSNKLNDVWTDDPVLELAKGYADLVTEREHLVHSHPATYQGGGTPQQRLRRYDIEHRIRPQTVKWILPEWLDEFVASAMAVNGDIRAAIQARTASH